MFVEFAVRRVGAVWCSFLLFVQVSLTFAYVGSYLISCFERVFPVLFCFVAAYICCCVVLAGVTISQILLGGRGIIAGLWRDA